MNIQSHPHWPALEKIYHTLVNNGHKAYLAGGCVRDALLGKQANDLDLATDATPDAIEKIFPKTVAVGKAFGVMLVIEEGISFEVATFRSDGAYADGRRPDSVVFTTPEEDARRRDFTVNALFYDLNQGRVLDFVGGVKDLADKKIKAVGVPEERFKEDHLRLLRAVRFAAQLDFEIDAETLAATKRLAANVKTVSAERVHEETLKLLKTDHALKGLNLMHETGLGKALFPGWQGVFAKSQQAYQTLFATPDKDETFAWMRFLSPWALQKDLEWVWILDNYRFPRIMHRHLKRALEHIENPKHFFLSTPGEQLSLLGEESVRLFIRICSQLAIEKTASDRLLKQWQAWGEKMPEAWVQGDDLKGHFEGRELGTWLHKCFVWQLEGRYSSREEMLAQVPNFLKT
ncbi:CCA tRNA nucleotidyltransferase [Bdellovibrio sp. HCB337]|uniref:CCA tRNA nucleotidyltransferase n=1 Tax=Bdellovibrio sp. HCB337 TaxID=3394358 RepID=UPI0039A5FD45